MSHEIENFVGVYLLCCRNEKYKGQTYIGFTVDPNRRIKQHNTGSHAGGAHRTSGKGPWDMVLIIHGFPNQISGLRFEWAWQNPKKSKRLRHVVGKRTKESRFQYRFRLVCEMLRTSPWNRLPLTVRWLKQEYQLEFDPNLLPPKHMPIQFGPVVPKKVKSVEAGATQVQTKANDDDSDLPVLTQSSRPRCVICRAKIQLEDNRLQCMSSECSCRTHTLCLAKHFLQIEGVQDSEMIPIEGPCPKCKRVFLWGDLVRFKHGCYQSTTTESDESNSQSHWADDLEI